MKISKINLIRIITLSVAACSLVTCVVVGVVINNNNKLAETTAAVEVDHIEVTKNPNKLDYFVGESFSRAGMVVTAYYSDSSSQKVMNYTIDKTGPLTLDDTVITITFKDKSTTLNITVSEKVYPTQLNITNGNTYTYKVEAEEFALGSEELGTDKSIYFETHNSSSGNPNTSGGVSLGKLNYTAETLYLRINSEVETTANIVLSMAFNPSLDFDDSVETKWNDETTTTGFIIEVSPVAQYVWFDWKEYTIPNLTIKKGFNELSLRLKDTSKLSPNYDYAKIEVNPIDQSKVTGIEVTTMPNKVEYTEGETFDSTGMVISALLDDGSKVAINDYLIDKTILSITDEFVTITYKEKFSVNVPISVTKASINSLTIEQMPKITTYYVGQEFDPTGLKIMAHTSDGLSQDVTSFVTFDKTILELGDTKVTATYSGASVDIPITINKDTNLTIDSDINKSYRIEAEDAFWVKGPECDKEKYNVVDDANASGGKRLDSLDWLKGSQFIVNIESKVETNVKIKVSSDGPGLIVKDVNPMTFNGETVELEENPTGGWLNFNEYKVKGAFDLHIGINTFIVKLADTQSVNFDYFEFEISPNLEVEGVEGISANYENVKTTYYYGESFDSTNLIVEAKYNDGSTKIIEDYTYSNKPLTLDDTFFEISWQGFKTRIPIVVKTHASIEEPKAYRIEAEDAIWTKGPECDKEKYNVVDDANASGGKRLDSLDWLKDSTFTMSFDSSKARNVTLNICCDGGGSGGNISNFSEITINGKKIDFSNDLAGGWGNLQVVSSNTFEINSGINALVVRIIGTGSVNYDYFEIVAKPTSEEIALDKITLDYSNVKTEYYAGETFDPTNLKVTAVYSDGKTEQVDDYTYTNEPLTLNDTEVVINYNGKLATIPIKVKTHIDITEGNKNYRLEAKDALWSKGPECDKEKYNVVDDPNASGGKRLDSLDRLKDSTFTITINSFEERDCKLVISCDGGGSGGNISNFAEILLNGKSVLFNTELEVGWLNFQTIDSETMHLNQGLNTLVIRIIGTGSVNYDYFELKVE